MISLIHPSRGRPQQSFETIQKWRGLSVADPDLIVSLDFDDPNLNEYKEIYDESVIIINRNRSTVDAINNGAKLALGDILIVVSDDTDCSEGWDFKLKQSINNNTDFILKTQDGIQPYIITMPIMDRAYYNRTGYIYHPDFQHLFCDTYLTCVADITGRKITSDLMFKHNHYSVNGTQPDELHKRNDATWKQGQETFIRLMKEFTPEQRAKITDLGMKNWLRKVRWT
jgi:glycosyltransferase involved in cell wall biosynthesis